MFPKIFFMEKCITFDTDNFCRCCLASVNSPEVIVAFPPNLTETFRTMTLVVPKSDEKLKICKSCKQNLDMAHNFRKMCQKADQKLQEVKSELATKFVEPTAATKIEVNLKVTVKNEPMDEEDEEPSRIALAFVDLKQYDENADVKKEPTESNESDDDSIREPSPPPSIEPEPPTAEQAATVLKTGKRMVEKLQCTLCFKYFSTTVAFMFHKDAHRNKEDRYICHQCGRSFKFRTSLMQHFRNTKNFPNHTKEGVFECLRCPKRYHFIKDLNNHMKKFHEERTLDFKCTEDGCDAAFAQELRLFEHKFSHTPGVFPFNCQDHSIEDCDYRTVSKDSFRRHLRRKHRILFEEKIHGWKQPQHDDGSAAEEEITKPELKIHSRYSKRLFEPTQEARQLLCRYCSRIFENLSGLQYHEKTAHENLRYYCEAPGCCEVFTAKQVWADHQWVHRDRMPFVCEKFFPECDYKCRLYKSFKLHLLKIHQTVYNHVVHGYSETSEELMIRKKLKKKPWDRIEHERKKMAGKTRFHLPYPCNMCDMSFAKDMALRYHVRKIHTLQATFRCKVCPYTTTVKRIMFEHAFEHREKYAWRCPHCDYQGNRQLKFKYHLKEHHDVAYDDTKHGYSKEKIQQIVNENTVSEMQERLAELSKTNVGVN